jgi:hypothetical protein
MIDPRSWTPRRAAAIEVALVGGLLIVAAFAGASLIGHGIPLGWDESVYASRSRSLVTDIPASVWKIYRPPALPIIGLLGGTFGFTDANLRAVSLVMSLLTGAGAWALTRVLWGRLAAIIALLTVIGSPIVINELVLFHTDLPAAGLLLALMLVIWHEFERRPQPTAVLLVAAPIAALVFYVRYGTVVALGGIGIAAVLLWHRPMRRQWRLVGATVAFAAVLLAPHVIDAVARTGSPIGIVASASDQVNTSGPLATAVRYLAWLPAQLAQRLGFVVMLAGVAYGAVVARDAFRRRALTAAARRFVFLYVPAGITAIGLVLSSHPEPRYVMFPVVLAIVAGAGAVSAFTGWLTARPRFAKVERGRALDVAIIGAVVVSALVVGAFSVRRVDALQRDGDRTRWWAEVGAAIGAEADGPCKAFTTLAPIVGWYSGCEGIQFSPAGARLLAGGGMTEPTYVVFTPIDERRASTESIERYRAVVEDSQTRTVAVDGAPPGVEVYRLGP